MGELEIVRKDMAPLQLKFFGVLIVLATNYKMLTWTFFDVNPLVFVFGNLFAVCIFTAKDILLINFDHGQIGEGFKILGFRYTDKTTFTGIEKIFINKVKTGETFRQMTRTMTIHHDNYKAFLKTSEGDKYWISVHSNKDKLIHKLKIISTDLNTEIYDYTLPEHTLIN